MFKKKHTYEIKSAAWDFMWNWNTPEYVSKDSAAEFLPENWIMPNDTRHEGADDFRTL